MVKIRWIPVSRTGMTGKKGTRMTPFFVLLPSKLQLSCSYARDGRSYQTLNGLVLLDFCDNNLSMDEVTLTRMITESAAKDLVSAIQNNLLVCFPTETVYALACNALSCEAIKKVYEIKKRSQNKPLSIFVRDINDLAKIAKVKEEHADLINRFSPGPLTYILPLKNNSILPSEFFRGSIGIRIPNHPIAISILNELNAPIVATSINISGEKSVYKAGDIPQSIKRYLSAVFECDESVSGVESTIIDLTEDKIKIVREGAVSLQELNKAVSSYRKKHEKSDRS